MSEDILPASAADVDADRVFDGKQKARLHHNQKEHIHHIHHLIQSWGLL